MARTARAITNSLGNRMYGQHDLQVERGYKDEKLKDPWVNEKREWEYDYINIKMIAEYKPHKIAQDYTFTRGWNYARRDAVEMLCAHILHDETAERLTDFAYLHYTKDRGDLIIEIRTHKYSYRLIGKHIHRRLLVGDDYAEMHTFLELEDR